MRTLPSNPYPANLASRWVLSEAVKKVLVVLVDKSLEKTPSTASAPSKKATQLETDKWGFGWDWRTIRKDFRTAEALYKAIGERRRQIEELKNGWRFYIEAIKIFDPLHASLEELCGRINYQGAYFFPKESIAPISDGISGSYFVKDKEDYPRLVLKPIDEDIGCLNNPKGFSSPYTESAARKNMPLYLSAMRETLAYEISKLIGADGIVPRTTLAIVESDAFYDQLDAVDGSERDNYEKKVGGPVHEKLCSAQEFVPDSKMLSEGLQELQAAGLSDDEIEARFDRTDFEEANILLWCTYDTDGHMGNFLVYPKSTDAIGNEILGVKKIDNGLAFPEKNEQLRNNLRYLPNAKQPLSREALAKIGALSVDALTDKLKQFGLGGSVDALKERIAHLKQIVKENPELSIKEIDRKMERIRQ